MYYLLKVKQENKSQKTVLQKSKKKRKN